MSETESAHGNLSKVDQQWTGPRFVGLLFGTLLVALVVIYVIASIKSGDFSYEPFAHDIVEHTLETSAM
ncbi:MAG TPA: hypothetical protein RMH99_33135 [Sandaracinaceae bacterium LLY-WYZ-13_1]|nr:hypothetical protein [Sandaracinaceae bacterium LLY-WYZ-13_1]